MNRQRLLIVGGVAGGASAAARARRLSETASILLFERGPHVSFANCGLPYHVGGEIPEVSDLLLQRPPSPTRPSTSTLPTTPAIIRVPSRWP